MRIVSPMQCIVDFCTKPIAIMDKSWTTREKDKERHGVIKNDQKVSDIKREERGDAVALHMKNMGL